MIGFYHSHPHSPAEPSAADVAEATYPGALYLIVSLVAETAVLDSTRQARKTYDEHKRDQRAYLTPSSDS